MKRRLLLAAAPAVVGAALVLGACSSGDHSSMDMSGTAGMSGGSMTSGTSASPIPADAPFSLADVTFAQSMIPHHAQAIEMADMALAQATDARIEELATAIKAAQGPEIAQLTEWLRSWGQPVSSTGGGTAGHDMSGSGPSMSMPGMEDMSMSGMGDMSMSGMMSDADMAALAEANGAAFDRMWLQMMIEHHRGAVTMAQEQLSSGKFQPAKDMARAIVDSQQAEITQMQALITQIPG